MSPYLYAYCLFSNINTSCVIKAAITALFVGGTDQGRSLQTRVQ